VRPEDPSKIPLLEVRGVEEHYRGGLWGMHEAKLRLGPGILGFVGPYRALRTVLVAVSSACLTTVLVVALLAGNVPLDLGALWQKLSPPERVRVFFEGFGAWGPLVFFSIQAIRVVVPFVPAGPLILVGVAVFGPCWGFALSLLGAFGGSVSAFLLARRFGRPMVARLVGEKILEKHAGKMGADGWWILVALMMPLPAAGDAVCALAGLSEVSLGRFAVLNLLGRIPYIALTVLLASGLNTSSGSLQTGCGIVAALLAGAAFFYTRRLRSQQRQSEGRLEDTRARTAPEDALHPQLRKR
jgi:uncharacterized membrane protein YdjX (TVP38/TMEM64 family)